jgi:hypothetical protein
VKEHVLVDKGVTKWWKGVVKTNELQNFAKQMACKTNSL